MSASHEDTLTMGTFLLDGQEFGVDILKQREVLRMLPVTKVPCASDFVEGVINLRGSIVPVVNLRSRFGMPRKDFDKETRILNIEVTGDLVIGFIVDRVGQVRRIDKSSIEAPPAVVATVDAEYISGIGKFGETLLIVLDIARILSDEDITHIGQLA